MHNDPDARWHISTDDDGHTWLYPEAPIDRDAIDRIEALKPYALGLTRASEAPDGAGLLDKLSSIEVLTMDWTNGAVPERLAGRLSMLAIYSPRAKPLVAYSGLHRCESLEAHPRLMNGRVADAPALIEARMRGAVDGMQYFTGARALQSVAIFAAHRGAPFSFACDDPPEKLTGLLLEGLAPATLEGIERYKRLRTLIITAPRKATDRPPLDLEPLAALPELDTLGVHNLNVINRDVLADRQFVELRLPPT